jgi:hypothetical protein
LQPQTPIEIKALASPALLERGCVNIISLEAIKEQTGDRWLRIRDNVYSRLETLLRQRLGPADFFARIDEYTYLVTMPSSEPEDVNIVCMRIAYELCSNLLGQCDMNTIRVSKAVSAGGDQMVLQALPSERLVGLAERAGIAEALKPPSAAVATPPEMPTGSSFSVIETAANRRKTLTIVHHYVPLWSTANSAVTTYICEPQQIVAMDVMRHNVIVPQLGLKERTNIEIACLREGVNRLARCLGSNNRFILAMPVSFEVLGSPNGRMEYLNLCRSMSQEYRQYIDFILTEVPPGVANIRLTDLVNTLRPFARGVMATVAPGTHDYSAYAGMGLRAIGFHKREFAHEHRFTAQEAAQLAHGAKQMRMNSFMLGIRRLKTLQTAYESGIQMISGPAVASAAVEPKGMWRLAWQDILNTHQMLAV